MPLPVLLTYAAGGVAVLAMLFVAAARAGVVQFGLAASRPRPRRRRGARSPRRRALILAGGVVATLVLVLAAFQGVALARATTHLQRGQSLLRDARAALGDDPQAWTPRNVANAEVLRQEGAFLIRQGQGELGAVAVVAVARHLPFLSDQARASEDLAASGSDAAAALGSSIKVAEAVTAARGGGAAPGQRLLQLLSDIHRPATDAVASLSTARSRLEADRGLALVPQLSSQVNAAIDQLSSSQERMRTVAVGSGYIPAALGGGRPQTYLVLLPNPSELRPTGGFSGAVASVTMSGGAPSNVDVHNQDDFNAAMKQRQPVPVALARYLRFYKNGLELGDAGWDPDFPTSAQTSEQLYNSATGKSVDGTISIDPYAIAAMLAVTGPVEVAPYGVFKSQDFFTRLNVIVNANTGPGQGKAALPPITQAVVSKVLSQPASSWPALLSVFRAQAEQRHLQAYFHDPNLAAAAATAKFDGALLAPPANDYLMLSDANVGATKGDAVVRKSMDIRTEIHPELGVARHQVTVTYDMPAATDQTDRLLNPGDGSYRDYLRFVLPREALVASYAATSGGKKAEGGLDVTSLAHDRQMVGAFLRVARGTRASIVIVYEVPLAPGAYHLYVQKQAGVKEIAVTSAVSYPGGVSRESLAMTTDLQFGAHW